MMGGRKKSGKGREAYSFVEVPLVGFAAEGGEWSFGAGSGGN